MMAETERTDEQLQELRELLESDVSWEDLPDWVTYEDVEKLNAALEVE